MKKYLFQLLLLISINAFAQEDSNRTLRAFPITDYMVDLNDSVKVVQLEMPDGITLKEKQLGIVYGVYKGDRSEVVQKGWGACRLIKGNYYYFAIHYDHSLPALKKGDLLYTFMEKPDSYDGLIPKLAAHFIRLKNVYDSTLYDRYTIFGDWTIAKEELMLDTLKADIRFTGSYFQKSNPEMDELIQEGIYKGKHLFAVMADCKIADVEQFLGYVIANPRLYAGQEWKISEIFATWVKNGAPAS